MQFSGKTLITKENAYIILKAFAKEYKKQNGNRVPIEIVIVGGGSILRVVVACGEYHDKAEGTEQRNHQQDTVVHAMLRQILFACHTPHSFQN